MRNERFSSRTLRTTGIALAPFLKSQSSPVGYADTHPIASNDFEEGRSSNRRIEIVLYPKDLKQIASQVETSTSASR